MKPKRRAFTFLELVISLSLIVLLAAILLPVFARARQSAKQISCASNLSQLGQALHLYAQDNNGRFPPSDHDWSAVQVYVKNYGVLHCPSDPVRLPNGYSSYLYRAGLASDDLGSTPISRDWSPWHLGGTNVLHLGGNVKWEAGQTSLMPGATRPLPPANAAPAAGATP